MKEVIVSERKWRRDMFCEVSKYSGLNALELILKEARAAEKSGAWRGLSMDLFHDDPYSDMESLGMFGERPETDAEQSSRLAQEAKWREAAEAREKEEFERLKKKFG